MEQDADAASITSFKMVLRIPETGLQLESSVKAAETLPLQAFAITLSDNVIEDLIQCVQNGDDIRLSLGNVPVSELIPTSLVAARGMQWIAYCSACRTIEHTSKLMRRAHMDLK